MTKSCSRCAIPRRRVLGGLAALLAAAPLRATAHASAAPVPGRRQPPRVRLPRPGKHDACPVCGMFPARYHEWIATIAFADGTAVHFDGAKDAFKFWLDMGRYDPAGHSQADVKAFGVTAYYSTEMIDARQALYVIGSDVLGPMGHDLVPHPDMYDAEAFMKDHHGKAVIRFEQVDMAMLQALDNGRFVIPGSKQG